MKIPNSKHAQIWSLDIASAIALFLVGVVIFFMYSANQPSQAEETFEILYYEGSAIANSLMSSGNPLNWNVGNVLMLGIVDDNIINQTKLEQIYEMNYIETKNLLGAQYDYYFFFNENMTINSTSVDGIGKPGVKRNNVTSKNLVKTTRYIVYQNKTTPLYIYTWEE